MELLKPAPDPQRFWNFLPVPMQFVTAGDVDRPTDNMTGEAPEISDGDLLDRATGGDEGAFTSLYRRRQAAVYRFALQMSGQRSVAEEVTQEVFLALIREAGRFDPQRGSVVSYLYGIARNHVLRFLERDRNYVAMEDEPESDSARWTSPEDTLARLTRGETIESVRRAVLSLPAIFREVVVLCDLHEMSYADAAAALGCAVGTVRSRLHRARGMLLERLKAKKRAFV
jgi:RNA polymerase sigma-70 factor, ECF subfamily